MKKLSFPVVEMKQLFMLAYPLMLSEFVDASFNFLATVFSAHLSIQELAAAGLVMSLFITIVVFMWGILISVSALVSQRHGAKDEAGIARVLRDGLLLATLMSVPAMLLLWFLSPILLFFGQKPETVMEATHYLHALTWIVFPDFCAIVLLQLMIGLGNSRIALYFTLIRIPITLSISYVLMFGKLGLPHLGIAGLGWGMTIGMWIATILLLAYIIWHSNYRHYLLGKFSKHKRYVWQIVKTGLPVAGMFSIEVGFFTVMALIMGRIDSHVLAANQIVTQFTGFFSVIISFCMAQAVTIRIGNAVGRNDLSNVERIVHAGVIITVTLMLLVAICYWFFPDRLISIDVDPSLANNRMIIQNAKQFLIFAALVQIFEAARLVLFGALRGLNENRFSMLTSLFVFWLIAFPIGFILTFIFSLGGVGMWIGMSIGTFFGALLLWWWFPRTLKRFARV